MTDTREQALQDVTMGQILQDTIKVADYASNGRGGAAHVLWKFFMSLYGYSVEISFDELRLLDTGFLNAVHRLFVAFGGNNKYPFERFVDEYKDEIGFNFRRKWD